MITLMERKVAELLAVGDVIMPPSREVRLWMRRRCVERGLSESALHLTVASVRESAPDGRGRWLVVTASHTPEWNEGRELPFRFKVRPGTRWQMAAGHERPLTVHPCGHTAQPGEEVGWCAACAKLADIEDEGVL
jgi:hypothetical protein